MQKAFFKLKHGGQQLKHPHFPDRSLIILCNVMRKVLSPETKRYCRAQHLEFVVVSMLFCSHKFFVTMFWQ